MRTPAIVCTHMSKPNAKTDARHAKIDHKILVEIDRMRDQYKACSVRMLSSQMRLSETAVRNRVNRMRGDLLDWCETGAGNRKAAVPGSVHLTPAGQERVDAWKAENAPTDREGLPTGDAILTEPASNETSGPELSLAETLGELVRQAIADAIVSGALTTATVDQEPAADHEDPTSPEE